MERFEYKHIQEELSALLKTEKFKRMRKAEQEVFEKAVLACKSVLSVHNPEREEKL